MQLLEDTEWFSFALFCQIVDENDFTKLKQPVTIDENQISSLGYATLSHLMRTSYFLKITTFLSVELDLFFFTN